jgi:chaperonin GroEL
VLRGVDKLVKTIQPTLGPLPRLVAVNRTMPGQAPELLDDGGLIARRIIQLPNRDEDIGAMYLRHLLLTVDVLIHHKKPETVVDT